MADFKSSINSVDRALALIEVLFQNSSEMGISEIAKAMGEYKSTIHRTLITLLKHGFVVQNPENDKYGLGPKLYAIGMAANGRFMLRETVRPFADQLHNEFSETVNVAIPDIYDTKNFSFLVIYRAESLDRVLRLNSLARSNMESHCSSLGKVLLAYNDDCEHYVEKMNLSAHTVNTITDKKFFLQHLNEVKKNGYAFDAEELEIGLTCIGMPVLNKQGKAVLAISVSGPTSRMNEKIDMIIQSLKNASLQISELLN